MSETPETDEVAELINHWWWVDYEFSERLERERDAARRIAERHAPDECPWLNKD